MNFVQNYFIGLATGNELAFVEARTIIQQYLDMALYQGFAMAVYGMPKFFFDIADALCDFHLFAR